MQLQYGKRYNSSYKHVKDLQCPNCKFSMLSGGFYDSIIGIDDQAPGVGGIDKVAGLIVECPNDREIFWFHISDDTITGIENIIPKFFEIKNKENRSELKIK